MKTSHLKNPNGIYDLKIELKKYNYIKQSENFILKSIIQFNVAFLFELKISPSEFFEEYYEENSILKMFFFTKILPSYVHHVIQFHRFYINGNK